MKRKPIEHDYEDYTGETPYYGVSVDRVRELDQKFDEAVELLKALSIVKNIYPEDVFRPVDLEEVSRMSGVSLDRISAEVLRHAFKSWIESADKILDSLKGEE